MEGFADMMRSVHKAKTENNLSNAEMARMLERLSENYMKRSNEKLSEEVQKAIEEHGLPFAPKEG